MPRQKTLLTPARQWDASIACFLRPWRRGRVDARKFEWCTRPFPEETDFRTRLWIATGLRNTSRWLAGDHFLSTYFAGDATYTISGVSSKGRRLNDLLVPSTRLKRMNQGPSELRILSHRKIPDWQRRANESNPSLLRWRQWKHFDSLVLSFAHLPGRFAGYPLDDPAVRGYVLESHAWGVP